MATLVGVETDMVMLIMGVMESGAVGYCGGRFLWVGVQGRESLSVLLQLRQRAGSCCRSVHVLNGQGLTCNRGGGVV